MREIRTEIEIAAPLTKVWSILTDIDSWKEWNPIVTQASGVASLGSTLSVTMCDDDGKDGPKYSPTITILEEPKQFRWRAKMMAGFLMTNDKLLELEEISSGTRLIHKELFSGILVPIFWSKLEKGCPQMLNSMNDALKNLAEKSNS
ncbi:MAG: SRPBCC family protein [Nitrospinales bacterium]